MANRKSIDEKLAELEIQKNQLKEKEKRLKAQQKEQDRKAYTKRLIEVGVTVENVLGRPIKKEDLPKLKKFLEQQEYHGEFFSKVMNVTQNVYDNDDIPF